MVIKIVTPPPPLHTLGNTASQTRIPPCGMLIKKIIIITTEMESKHKAPTRVEFEAVFRRGQMRVCQFHFTVSLVFVVTRRSGKDTEATT